MIIYNNKIWWKKRKNDIYIVILNHFDFLIPNSKLFKTSFTIYLVYA